MTEIEDDKYIECTVDQPCFCCPHKEKCSFHETMTRSYQTYPGKNHDDRDP